MRTAVIGIGSNSVRMLLADVVSGEMKRLSRERAGTRLFAGLDQSNRLSPEAMEKTVAAVAEMARHAREQGAEEMHLFATSATRDAANGAEFARLLLERSGLELEIISGREEAALSFFGAGDGTRCGVMDIGGGSTEIVIGKGMNLETAFSCQMGAVRLFRLYPLQSSADLSRVEQAATELLEEKLAECPRVPIPKKWFGTGGTFTTLAAMIRGISWTERTYMHGTLLTRDAVERIARQLADMSLEERLRLPGLQPNRADIVVHGICILLACMRRLDIDAIAVSEYGNLDGYVQLHYVEGSSTRGNE